MTLSGSQRQRVMEVMQKLRSRTISKMFAQAVDPIRDSCPDYFDIVKQPMDLGTVMHKLETDQYKSVADWKSDINLIFSNSNLYNAKASLLRLITKDLSDMFTELVATLSDSPSNDWIDTLQALGAEMNQVMKDMIPPPNPKQTKNQSKKEVPKKQSKPKEKPKPKVPEREQPKEPEKKSKKETPRDPEPAFSKEELLKLTSDINSIQDEEILTDIAELLRACESSIDGESEEIEVDLNTLRYSTLVLLRKKVDEVLGL